VKTWDRSEAPSSEAEGELGWSQPLGYESFEHRSEVVHLAPSRAIYLGFGLFPTGSGPALFVLVSDGLVSKP
jgi:hypothetical protein